MGLVDLMRSHPRVVVEHRDIVLLCLHDADFTIRTRALELLAGIVSRKSLIDIVKHLLQHVNTNEGDYRDQVVATVLQICSRDKYAMIMDFPWYISVLTELITIRGSKQSSAVASQLIEVCLRVKDIRDYAVHAVLPFLLDMELILNMPRDSSDNVFHLVFEIHLMTLHRSVEPRHG